MKAPWLALLAVVGCAHTAPPPLPPPPVAWTTSLDRAHPLVGKIWDVKRGRFVSERDIPLEGYVLLGEKHDNPDHHALQARLIETMAARHPVVAFEMLDLDRSFDAARDPDAVARAADWEHSGWPDFAMYRPVVQAALATGMPLVPTGLPRAKMRAVMKGEASEFPTPAPIDAAETASLGEELVADHCGMLPERMVPGMARVQRTRDATMARAMVDARARTHTADAVLVAGTGHTRRDRGVGHDLAALDPSRPVVSVAFVEVDAERQDPAAYASSWHARSLPFDYVWFTPRANDDDPCAEMRAPTSSCAGETFGLATGALDVTNGIIAKKRGTMGHAKKQMVASSHRLATEAGLAVLRKGGNAADAFVAAALAQDVVLPGVTSTAGLAGVLVYEAKTGKLTYVHGGLADPIDVAARHRANDTAIGKQVLVPGAPGAYAELVKRFGKKKLTELVEPAATIATDGFEVDGLYAGTLAHRKDALAKSPYGRATFFKGDAPLAKGDTIKLPELGKTLRAYGKDPGFFYKGAWPRAASELVKQNGGALVPKDFEGYTPDVSAPMHATYKGYDVYAGGHGGMKLLVSLEALETMGGAVAPADAIERLLRVQKNVAAVPQLRDRALLAKGGGNEDLVRAAADAVVRQVKAPAAHDAGTHSSAVVVVDAEGNVVVGTHTIESQSWGEALFVSGVPLATAAGSGVDDASVATHRVRPDPLSNTIVLKDGKPRVALAVYGTGLHPADVQILENVLAHGKNAEDAVLEPRVGYLRFDITKMKLDPDVHSADPRLPTDLLCTLKQRGVTLERSMPGYPPGIVDTGFPTLVTIGEGLEGMTPELVSGVAAGD